MNAKINYLNGNEVGGLSLGARFWIPKNREPSCEIGTHGSCQIPQPNPEGPHEGAPDPIEEVPDALNADINLSAFFSPQTGQIISSEPVFEEKTNSSKR